MSRKNLAGQRISVSMRAVVLRINRKLVGDDQILRSPRGHAERSFGDFYIVDVRRGLLLNANVQPEKLARELGVLHSWEIVDDGAAA
jgi:hypothetical protein